MTILSLHSLKKGKIIFLEARGIKESFILNYLKVTNIIDGKIIG